MDFESTANQLSPKSGPQSSPTPNGAASPIDQLQIKVTESGGKIVESIGLTIQAGALAASLKRAEEALTRLNELKFRVGFAGAQSSGKSAVINSLLDYPLAPTCSLNTTCAVVDFTFGEFPRVIVKESENGAVVKDIDCRKQNKRFKTLIEYACAVCKVRVIENLGYFTDKNLDERDVVIHPEDLKMDGADPKLITMLLLILFAVELPQDQRTVETEEMRKALFRSLGLMPEKDYSFTVLWNNELLSSGMVLVDLPGLGSINRKHDGITANAITETDAMVFIIDKTVKPDGLKAVESMLSKARMQNVGTNELRIVPIINRCDEPGNFETARDQFIEVFNKMGLHKKPEDVIAYTALLYEYNLTDIPPERTMYYKRWIKENPVLVESLGKEMIPQIVRKQMGVLYQQSNIDQLKAMFRQKIVERGKYLRILEAMQTLHILSNSALKRTNALIKSFLAASKVAGVVNADLLSKLLSAVQTPISEGMNELDELWNNKEKIEAIKKQFSYRIPQLYIKCCNRSIGIYSDELIRIANKFDRHRAMRSRARVDKAGSKNASVYRELLDAINDLDINIEPVEEEYTKQLKSLIKLINSISENTVDCLNKAKNEIIKGIKDIIEHAKDIEIIENSQLSNDEDAEKIEIGLSALDDLGDSLVRYIKAQHEASLHDLDHAKDQIEEGRKSIIRKINKQSEEICKACVESVQQKTKMLCVNGSIIKSHKYISLESSFTQSAGRITCNLLSKAFPTEKKDGSFSKTGVAFKYMGRALAPEEVGLITFLSNLKLSRSDEDRLRNNLRSSGQQSISNHVANWIKDSVNSMLAILVTVNEEVNELIKEVARDFADSEGDYEKMIELLNNDVKLIVGCSKDYSRSITSTFKQVADTMNDTSESTAAMIRNPMQGVVDNDDDQ